MLRMSVQSLPLTPLFWQLWLALATVGFVAWKARRSARPGANITRLRWILELAALLVVPLSLLAIGLGFWESLPPARERLEVAVWIVAALELLIGLALVWRHRGRAPSTVVAVCAALVWTTGAVAVSSKRR
jgi:hypothetical protein